MNRRVHERARYKHLTLSQMVVQLFGWRARLELAGHDRLVPLYLVHGRRGYSCKQGFEARLEFVKVFRLDQVLELLEVHEQNVVLFPLLTLNSRDLALSVLEALS